MDFDNVDTDLPEGEFAEFVGAVNKAKGIGSTDRFKYALERLRVLAESMEEEEFAEAISDMEEAFLKIEAKLANSRY